MRKLTSAVFAAGALAASSAIAAPIGLPGGPLYFQYSNAEQVSTSNSIVVPGGGGATEGNWGIVQLSIIQQGTALSPQGSDIQGGGSTLFVNGQNGGNQILGIFQGSSFIAGDPTHATGGVLDLYWFDSNSQNVGTELSNALNLGKRTAADQYTGFTCASPGPGTGCTLLAQLNFVSGSAPGIPGVTVSTAVDPQSSDGTAKSYLSVDTSVVGAWTTVLDTNFFTLDPNNLPVGFSYPPNTPVPGTPGGVSYPNAADVRLDSNFTHNGGGNWSVAGTDIVGLRSNDPGRAAAIPEPGSLALMGLALMAMTGFAARRRG